MLPLLCAVFVQSLNEHSVVFSKLCSKCVSIQYGCWAAILDCRFYQTFYVMCIIHIYGTGPWCAYYVDWWMYVQICNMYFM